MQCEISLGSATSSEISGTTTPAQVIADIRGGKWQTQVAALRQANKATADNIKRQLPAVLWSGTFAKRAKAGLLKHSGLICADIDKVPDRVAELHDTATRDPHTLAAFVSPSGTGLKIVFRTPENASHPQSFVSMRAHVAAFYRAEVDEAAKDVSRLCFVSSDPAAFFNTEALPLPLTPAGTEQGSRNNAAFELALQCRDQGKTPVEAEEEVLAFAAACKPPLPETEAKGCVRSAFSQPPRLVERPLPEIVDAADFIAEEIPQPPELVAGILHKGSKLAFGGSSKSFKTWNLLDLALSIAHGKEWLGFQTQQGRVLFCNFELQTYAWQKRVVSVAKAKGIEMQRGNVCFWNLRGHAAEFRKIIPRIIERTREENFALIVLDPIYKVYGNTDENSAGEVAAMLNELERMAVDTGAAVAFGAHFAKGNASGKEAIDRISGSGVFARDPDSLLIFTKHEAENAFTVEPILRNFAPVDPFAVRWQFPLMSRADDLDPARLKQSKAGRKREHDPRKILQAISHTMPEKGISISAWAQAAALPRQTLTDYLPELRRLGYIATSGEGSNARQYITAKGKELL